MHFLLLPARKRFAALLTASGNHVSSSLLFGPTEQVREIPEEKELYGNRAVHVPAGVDTGVLLRRRFSHTAVHVPTDIRLVFDARAAADVRRFQRVDQFRGRHLRGFIDNRSIAHTGHIRIER